MPAAAVGLRALGLPAALEGDEVDQLVGEQPVARPLKGDEDGTDPATVSSPKCTYWMDG